MTFTISQKQARDVATCIVSEIAEYVRTHQAEYQEFLRQEQADKQKVGDILCKK